MELYGTAEIRKELQELLSTVYAHPDEMLRVVTDKLTRRFYELALDSVKDPEKWPLYGKSLDHVAKTRGVQQAPVGEWNSWS